MRKPKTPWLLIVALCLCSCTATEPLSVIPYPQHAERKSGVFLPEGANGNSMNARMLDSISLLPYNEMKTELSCYGITVSLEDSLAGVVSEEGYRLSVSKDGVRIRAISQTGAFYAMGTLSQLYEDGGFPCVEITDWPRFKYRGMHLDVSRHFKSKEFVMKQLDAMARYKLNRFHWHLTDGAGWRIEIDRYPELTGIAAWRPYPDWKSWWNGGRKYCTADHPDADGGYYTKEDVREIVQYAAQRHITVIPEIEMPGHSEEVLAVYPELSCSGEPYVNSELCVGKEATFEFLENVLSEVMELFPSEYIHIGGDEAAHEGWKSCPDCQLRIKEEGLGDEAGLQGYLVRRIEAFLNRHGRKLIGWDEILRDSVNSSSVIMAWRGLQYGADAVKSGHDVIMTPGDYCYIDAYQDAPFTQPEARGGYLTLEKTYSFEPVPDTLSSEEQARYIGIQSNLWCEYISTEDYTEYMLYPRVLSIAETAWTSSGQKDWRRFRKNVIEETDYLKLAGYNPFDIRKEKGERPEASRPEEHLAVGKKIEYVQPFSPYYPAGGETALVDGVRGGWTYADGRWQGFINRDVDVIIDLGEDTDIHYIGAEFMQLIGPWLWQPAEVIISVSEDGQEFAELSRQFTDVPKDADELIFRTYAWEGEVSARYVRYNALNNKIKNGCLFTDEIIVR